MYLNRLRFSLVAAAGLAVAATAAPDFSVTPGADVLLRVNMKALQSSPLMKELTKDQPEDKALDAEFLAATGLTKDDVLGISAAVVLDGVTEETMANPEALMATLPVVGQIHLAKPVTADQLLKGIKLMNDKTPRSARPQGGVRGRSHPLQWRRRQAFLRGRSDARRQEPVPRPARRGCEAGRGACGFGQTPAGVSAELASVLDKDAHINLAVVLPAALRAKIKAQMDEMKSAPDAGPQALMFAPFGGLKSVSISAKMNAADADFGLMLDLGTPDNATAANGTLSMFAMMLGSQMGPAGQKLRFVSEGSIVKLKMNLTKAELMEAGKGAMQSAGGGLGGEEMPEEEEVPAP
jgi:hypothetical protein